MSAHVRKPPFTSRIKTKKPEPKTDFMKKSVAYHAIFLWNNLDNSARSVSDSGAFGMFLKSARWGVGGGGGGERELTGIYCKYTYLFVYNILIIRDTGFTRPHQQFAVIIFYRL